MIIILSHSAVNLWSLEGQEGAPRHSSNAKSSPICTILMANFYVPDPHKAGKTWTTMWHEVMHDHEFWSNCSPCSLYSEWCHSSLQNDAFHFFPLFFSFVRLLMQGKLELKYARCLICTDWRQEPLKNCKAPEDRIAWNIFFNCIIWGPHLSA